MGSQAQNGLPKGHTWMPQPSWKSSKAIEISLTLLLSLTKLGWKDESTEWKPTQDLKRQDNDSTQKGLAENKGEAKTDSQFMDVPTTYEGKEVEWQKSVWGWMKSRGG